MSGSDLSGEMKRRDLLGVDLLSLDHALNGQVRPRATHKRVMPTSDASKPVDPKCVQAVFWRRSIIKSPPIARLSWIVGARRTCRTGTRFVPQRIGPISALYQKYGYEHGVDLSESIAMCGGDIFWPANITKAA